MRIIMRKGLMWVAAGLATLALSGSPAGAMDKDAEGWRRARGMSGGAGADVVKVRMVGGGGGAAALDHRAGRTLELEYAIPGLKVAKKGNGAALGAGAGPDAGTDLEMGNVPLAGNPGKPVLPVVPCYVILPEGENLESVEVVCGKETKLPGRHTIRHGEKPIPLIRGAKAEPAAPDPAVYDSDEPWPREKREVVTVQKRRGVSILVVNLNPVVYRPKSGEISWFADMKLRVKTSPAPKSAGAVAYRPDPIRPVSEQVDNPETLQTYGAAPENGPAKP